MKSTCITEQHRFPVLFGIIFLFGLSQSATAEDMVNENHLKQRLSEIEDQFETLKRNYEEEIKSLKSQIQELRVGQNGTASATALPIDAASPQTADPKPAAGGKAGPSYMNISFNSILAGGYSTDPRPAERLQLGDHDPQKRGFSLRNAELALDGAVDPYFKGFANILLKLDEDDETEIELEESYLQTITLPGNLQLKGGQFFANFGRHNSQHPHQWAFVDQPIILNRALGPDGLRNVGTQVSWLIPTPFYSEAFLGILDSQGGTAHNFRNSGDDDEEGIARFHGRETNVDELRGPGDLLFTPRLATSLDLSDSQTVVAGLSAAFGPNATGSGKRTQIYGGDLYWKWKPVDSKGGFPFVSIQSEGIYSRFEAGEDLNAPTPLTAEILEDYGLYAQFVWGFSHGWTAGTRAEYASGNTGEFDSEDVTRGERYRLSPALTYYPSEFSKIRLQYNFDSGEEISDASSIWMQLEFNLGSHAAHKF